MDVQSRTEAIPVGGMRRITEIMEDTVGRTVFLYSKEKFKEIDTGIIIKEKEKGKIFLEKEIQCFYNDKLYFKSFY